MFARTGCFVMGLLLLAAGGIGCEQDEIRAYRAPKDPPLPSEKNAAADRRAPARPSMDWAVPQGWRQQPGQRQMRVATFEVASVGRTVEVAVSAFPGSTGGLLANVNRWRGQVSLDPIGQDQLSGVLVPFSNDRVQGHTLDLMGPVPTQEGQAQERILGAIIDDGAGMTWFVKAKDAPSVLEPIKEDLVRFARSFRIKSDHAHHDHPPAASDTSRANPGVWQPPDHWKADANPSQVLAAAYDIHTPRGDARATVTVLAGDGGGLLANLNRWRQQLGLEPVDDLEQQPRWATAPGTKGPSIVAFDLMAPPDTSQERQRFLVAVLTDRNQTRYVKLAGPDEAVTLEKRAFEELVESVRSSQIQP